MFIELSHLWRLIDGWQLTERTEVCWSAPSQNARAPCQSPRCRLSSRGRGSPSPGTSWSGKAWLNGPTSLFSGVLFSFVCVCFMLHWIKCQFWSVAVLRNSKYIFSFFSCLNKSWSHHWGAQHDSALEAVLNWHRGRPGPGTDAGAGAASAIGLWSLTTRG